MRIDGNQRRYAVLAASTLAAVFLAGYCFASAGDSESKVKISATAGKIEADGKQMMTLTLVIDKGWHIYANPVKNEGFESLRTEVKVVAKVKPAKVDVRYPAGKVYPDKTVGSCMIYENKIDIPVIVYRAPGDTNLIDIDVTIVACDANSCLPPATVRVRPK